ncbi:MAG: hypothetical protein ABW110_07635 [Steroidobacteraceae bacterium]
MLFAVDLMALRGRVLRAMPYANRKEKLRTLNKGTRNSDQQ